MIQRHNVKCAHAQTRNYSKHTKENPVECGVSSEWNGHNLSLKSLHRSSVSCFPVVKQLYIDFCFQLEISYKNGRAKLYPYFIWQSHILKV